MPSKKQPPPEKPSKKEGNKFDKIIKENLEALIPALIHSVLKYRDIKLVNLPKTKLQTTIEREPDFLKKMLSAEYPDGCVLQIEFEGKDDKDTDYRMLEYGGILVRVFKMPIDQHVIYLLEGKPKNIKGGIRFKNISNRYSVHSLWEISYKHFITASVPEEVILGILANRGNEPPDVVIRLILERLIELKGDSLATQKFIKQLEILSELRKLQTITTKLVDEMVIDYDITKDARFLQGRSIGHEEGIEQGIGQGVLQGIKLGAVKKSIESVLNMSDKGFKTSVIAEVLAVTPEFVITVMDQYKKKDKIIEALNKEGSVVEKVAEKIKVMPLLVAVIKDRMRKKK